MRIRHWGTLRLSPFLLVSALPAGIGLSVLPAKAAQTADPKTLPPPVAATAAGVAAPQTPAAKATQTAPPAGVSTISDIVVIGNKTLSSAYIIAASGHKVGDPCNDQTLFDMKSNLFKTGNFGMHSADPEDAVRVRSEESNPPNGHCRVVIEVDENDTVQSVQVNGSGPIKPAEILPLIHVKAGTVYNPNQLVRDTADIQDLYGRRGYIAAFDQSTGLDEHGVLNVSIIVTRVAQINIVKNRKTRRSVILREMHTKVGDYYNQNTLNGDVKRLFNLDLFEDVNISTNSDLGPGRIGITVSLPEKRTGVVSVGVGFSNRSQLIGRAEITETNFRGMGEQINLLWETGGPVNRNSVVLGFTEPWLDKRHTAMNVQLYDRTEFRFANSLTNVVPTTNVVGTDNRYNEQHVGASLTFSRPFRDTYRGLVTLRGENVRTDPLGLSLANAQIIQDGPVETITGSVLHNSRDLDLDPIIGNYQSIGLTVGHADLKPVLAAVGLATPGVFGSVNFARPQFEVREYFPLAGLRPRNKPDADKPALAMRLILGTTVGTLPFYEQYFLGGAESLRGYREDRFWGKNELLGSAEVRLPLARRLKGVIFLDAGHAWGGPYGGVEIAGFHQSGFALHIGTGVGIRVGTPIGPLRLDFGFGSEGGRTHFSIGNVF